MARLTLPRMNKETNDLVKFSSKLTTTRAYLRELCGNPKASDTELVKQLRQAEGHVASAKTELDMAVRDMAAVAKTLERRKAAKGK